MSIKMSLDAQVEKLVNKTRQYLITTLGRALDEASNEELYRAVSYAIRDEIMINWRAATHTQDQEDVRILYYLSLEYLPGRIFSNTLTNLEIHPIVQLILTKLNRNYFDIMGAEAEPGLGNGGLGRLAACFLDSLATHQYPARAYGLRYQYGIFEQQLWNGVQIEAPDCWLINENPWEFRRDQRKVTIKYCGQVVPGKNSHGDETYQLKNFEEVWALPYDVPIIGYSHAHHFGVLSLRLWSTKESPRNFHLQRYNAGLLDQAAENTTLTDVLYPSENNEMGKRIRLKQEFLLVSASLQDIIRHYLTTHDNLDQFADKVRIQINDTHPALIIPELVRILTQTFDIDWHKALETTQAVVGYTNHTILKEALEEWDRDLIFYLLPRQCKIIERINQDFLNTIRKKYPNDEEKIRRMSVIENNKVRMANLAVLGAHKINGVAELHSDILKKTVFKDFYELYPEKFTNVTNGVTQRRWLLHSNPELANWITSKIGDKWISDFWDIRRLVNFASDPVCQDEFLAIKKNNKLRLIEFLQKDNLIRDENGIFTEHTPQIDVDSLFDIQIKRIHEYKRQLMNILNIIMIYQDMLRNPDKHTRIKRTSIFGGKAAAGYETAKDIIQFINCVARKINKDKSIGDALKVVYIENYNVSKAEIIIPAAELSEQISTAGFEASGTGNMKLTINGALTIGTHDGANIEMEHEVKTQWWPFAFGRSSDEIDRIRRDGSYHPANFLKNPLIAEALNTLRDGTFSENAQEHSTFSDLYHKLLESHYGGAPDRYMTLLDLESYHETQQKVEELYSNPRKWAEFAIHNISGMGKFSTDNSIHEYCEKIWGIKPCLVNEDTLEWVRKLYHLE